MKRSEKYGEISVKCSNDMTQAKEDHYEERKCPASVPLQKQKVEERQERMKAQKPLSEKKAEVI